MRTAQSSAASLERFVEAQAPVYAEVHAELAAGHKCSHWMWFVFPQLRALGHSGTARFFGLQGRAEAAAYLVHPLLRERLLQCTQQVLDVRGKSAAQIFGAVDALKLRSCMTLFDAAAPHEAVFAAVLAAFYGGERDGLTQALLAQEAQDAQQAQPLR